MDQKTALKILKEGRNTFITGSAGAGKTYVLNEFIDWCNEENKFLAVTASTGIAATHLGGQTIHSFSGIGIHNDVSELNDMFFDKWAFKKFKAPDIRLCDVLIIDEISMLSAEQFEMIDYVFRKVRRKTGAFGGVQVVVCGDFFQLPPIGRNGQKPQFATESSAWEESDFAICYLTEQHRQNDDDYNELLESMRSGELTKKHIDLLKERVLSNIAARGDAFEESQEELNESRLYTHNLNTAQYNAERLKMLDGEEKEFVMTGDGPESMVATLKRGCLAPEKLKLKIGAVVISLKNDPDCEYVNGSVGKVVDFDSKNNDPIVQFENGNKCIMEEAQWQITSIETGEELASIKQIPLTLAWGITIHKSQGMTLGKATIDLRKAFEPGMGYVALSRLRSFSDLTLLGFNDIAIRTSDKARELDKYFRERSQLLETLYGE